MLEYHGLENDSLDLLEAKMLEAEEGYVQDIYLDSKGIPTIGIGINATVPANIAIVADVLGISTTAAELQAIYNKVPNITSAQEQSIQESELSYLSQLTAVTAQGFTTAAEYQNYLNGVMSQRAQTWYYQYLSTQSSSFVFSSNTEAEAATSQIVANISTPGNPMYSAFIAGIPASNEQAALISLYFNLPSLLGPGLEADINDNDRAGAWYEIRFDSNGGASPSDGIATRRYLESQVFDLYSSDVDPSGTGNADFSLVLPSVAFAEISQIFEMYTGHWSKIVQYDSTYVDDIGAANSNYQSFLNYENDGFQVLTTDAAFMPAFDYLSSTFAEGVYIQAKKVTCMV
jgi:GH24 family phage-related lysozyme (muramidase)